MFIVVLDKVYRWDGNCSLFVLYEHEAMRIFKNNKSPMSRPIAVFVCHNNKY